MTKPFWPEELIERVRPDEDIRLSIADADGSTSPGTARSAITRRDGATATLLGVNHGIRGQHNDTPP